MATENSKLVWRNYNSNCQLLTPLLSGKDSNCKNKASHSANDWPTTWLRFTVALKDNGIVLIPSPVTPAFSLIISFTQQERRPLHSSTDPSPFSPITGPSFSIQDKVFKRQNPRKAAGPDSVSPSILKYCADQLSPVLTDIFKTSWRNAMCQAASRPPPSSLSPKNPGSQV